MLTTFFQLAIATFISNKTGYTATPVTCGWAGAVLEKVIGHQGRSSKLKKIKNAEKVKRGQTDQPTVIAGCRVAKHGGFKLCFFL